MGQVSVTQGHLSATNPRSVYSWKTLQWRPTYEQKSSGSISKQSRRRAIIRAVRGGASMRSVARRWGVSLCTVQRWVARGKGKRLERTDLSDRLGGCPASSRRTSPAIEDLVLGIRADLKANSDLGEYGAVAVHSRLVELEAPDAPSLRTINRIFERRGVLDSSRRVRRPAPPPGWYLPEPASRAELDSFDIVEGLVIGRTLATPSLDVEVLNVVSLRGGLVGSWPAGVITAKFAAESAVEHWRACGLPVYAQFDNDTIFQGAHQWPDTFGRITRLCLGLGVVPVFAPPRETGFQAAIENYNGRWQAKVWARFKHASIAEVVDRSNRFVAAARIRSAVRIESAPSRRPFPDHWRMSCALQAPLAGRVIFLRRAGARGQVDLLGHSFDVDPLWPGRLVRADVDLDVRQIQFHALRRRDPSQHRLLRTLPYTPPTKRFRE